MREIFFRAWIYDSNDINKGSMVKVDWLGKDKANCKGDIYELGKENGCIIMQNTGLNDKDGNEIYEGDGIKIAGPNATHMNDLGQIAVIVWDQKMLCLMAKFVNGIEPLSKYATSNNSIFVMGNIHENRKFFEENLWGEEYH